MTTDPRAEVRDHLALLGASTCWIEDDELTVDLEGIRIVIDFDPSEGGRIVDRTIYVDDPAAGERIDLGAHLEAMVTADNLDPEDEEDLAQLIEDVMMQLRGAAYGAAAAFMREACQPPTPLAGSIEHDSHYPLTLEEAVANLATTDSEAWTMNHPGGWSCSEADAIAGVLRLAFGAATADVFLAHHAEGDDDEGDQHAVCFTCEGAGYLREVATVAGIEDSFEQDCSTCNGRGWLERGGEDGATLYPVPR